MTTRTTTIPRGGRFFHELAAEYHRRASLGYAHRDTRVNPAVDRRLGRDRIVLAELDDPETRRLVIDARQAAMFADMSDMPPIPESGLRTPFDQFYVEFTEPVVGLGEAEPGFDEELIAFTVTASRVERANVDGFSVLMFFRAHDASGRLFYTDRGFMLTRDGAGYSSYINFTEDLAPDVSTFPEDVIRLAGEAVDGGDSLYVNARPDGEGRGIWERMVSSYAAFVAWTISYMTARGVVLVEQSESRQVLRAMARRGERPRPWHVVMVKPTRYTDADEGGGGREHGYRYDVRGHLRIGRHKRGDGTYAERIEWVRPHQRGLKHTLYVPKTYLYRRGS